jgi:hypothetical protein
VKAGIGFRVPAWHVDETHKFLLDVFTGVGYRRISTRTPTYGGTAGTTDPSQIIPYPEPKTEKSVQFLPSVQVGAILSFAWAK